MTRYHNAIPRIGGVLFLNGQASFCLADKRLDPGVGGRVHSAFYGWGPLAKSGAGTHLNLLGARADGAPAAAPGGEEGDHLAAGARMLLLLPSPSGEAL